jgi:hypothetical protein
MSCTGRAYTFARVCGMVMAMRPADIKPRTVGSKKEEPVIEKQRVALRKKKSKSRTNSSLYGDQTLCMRTSGQFDEDDEEEK